MSTIMDELDELVTHYKNKSEGLERQLEIAIAAMDNAMDFVEGHPFCVLYEALEAMNELAKRDKDE